MPAERVTKQSPCHVVLVLEDSNTMAGLLSHSLNEAFGEFLGVVTTLNRDERPGILTTIISYGSGATIWCEYASEREIERGFRLTLRGDSGASNLGNALRTAEEALSRNPGKDSDFVPYVIIVAASASTDGVAAADFAHRVLGLQLPSGQPRVVLISLSEEIFKFQKKLAANIPVFGLVPNADVLVQILSAIPGILIKTSAGSREVDQNLAKLLKGDSLPLL